MKALSINVTQIPYNAIGDDSTDNTLAIQTAINDSKTNDIKLEFPKGIYLISGSLTIPSDIEIDFGNATIKRKAGSGVFDMIKNSDETNGNSNIILRNLIIDGNKDVDNLKNINDADRFSGLKLVKVSDSRLENIRVTRTVNFEIRQANPAAGIWLKECVDTDGFNIDGDNNDGTAIITSTNSIRVRIIGSRTYENNGSGIAIAGDGSTYCELHNLVSYENNTSNVTVNGKYSKVTNVTTFKSKFSGLNIGHGPDGPLTDPPQSPADFTFASNIYTYENDLQGLTIAGSEGVHVTDVFAEKNKKHNIRIFALATKTKLSRIVCLSSEGTETSNGILYETGIDHVLENSKIAFSRDHGVVVTRQQSAGGDTLPKTQVDIGFGMEIYNNGQGAGSSGTQNASGILLEANAEKCKVFLNNIYDDQTVKTQKYGLRIASGTDHQIVFPENIKDNSLCNIQRISPQTNEKKTAQTDNLSPLTCEQ